MTEVRTQRVRGELAEARQRIANAGDALRAHPPEVAELYATVDGVMEVSTALVDLIDAAREQAPATLNGEVLDELDADLQAMRGCVSTGPLLLAPTRDDLYALLSPVEQIRPCRGDGLVPDV
ncbi:hypothetical protein [Haloechinothrix sp. LS1_15]|uniref:hypothetical protein n=1 Tax=Haloechinothrix sp. LS1_15 TaxID=2652248 RepID=UPI002946FE36|nr:hypothetical protein [Haloechinothrix sp. LS1_15]MDV6013866.1 hypothetical protein [Haloechinothrix sp. LS1_15]